MLAVATAAMTITAFADGPGPVDAAAAAAARAGLYAAAQAGAAAADISDIPGVIDAAAQAGGSTYSFISAEVSGKNCWRASDGVSCYLDENGRQVTGFRNIGSGTYYFDQTGALRTGWFRANGHWYYGKTTGIVKGWLRMSGDDYYFDINDGHMFAGEYAPDGRYLNSRGQYDPDAAKGSSSGSTSSYDYAAEWRKYSAELRSQYSGGTAAPKLSGVTVGGMPAEFYMLSIAGETSGSTIVCGDRGRAYGMCQFDYRYDLTDFMKYAYDSNPALWSGFKSLLGYKTGDENMINDPRITNAFYKAMLTNYQEAMSTQLRFFRMLYWDGFAEKLNAAGFDLDRRNIAVKAAMLSVNINCGAQPNLFIANMDPSMSDMEMLLKVYELRNTLLAEQMVGSYKKGTSTRYRKAEPKMALDLMYGKIDLDSVRDYGGGVEWRGNIFGSPDVADYVQKAIATAAELNGLLQ